ncbi:MAG: hypothetical protein QOF78_2908 [Phycisphaerales bacterium]|jgi:hypothetical protein|nr:hypothetical protein [Phycisphaerales bacterium]
MSKFSIACIVALTMVGLAGNAGAAILLQDNFETYANQAAFQAAWPASGTGTAGNSGTLTTAESFSPPNSINYPTATGFRNNKNFGDTTGTVIVPIEWSFRFFDSDSTAGAYRQYSEIIDGAGSGVGQLIALGLNNNIVSNHYMVRVLGSDAGSGVSAFAKLDGAGVPTRTTGWHELKAVIKGSSADFYVDGFLSKTVPINTVRAFDTIRLGSNLSATRSANYDNVLVQTIPEPATLGLLALAGGALIRRRRKA